MKRSYNAQRTLGPQYKLIDEICAENEKDRFDQICAYAKTLKDLRFESKSDPLM